MAKSEARRQKQLAKKKAKREDKRAYLVRQNSDDPTIRFANAEHWPIEHALISDRVWDIGIGPVILARRCPDGRLAFANFLIDMRCLGVKDAYWAITSESEFETMIRKVETGGPMRKVEPQFLTKLVFDAVDYAQTFGFPPPHDYRSTSLLLAGIDATQCQEAFVFGRDGKPFYVQGPHDSPAKVRSILQRLGNGIGHFMLAPTDGVRVFDNFDSSDQPHVLEE